MPDMLVKLYDLPEISHLLSALKETGTEIRQARPTDKRFVTAWVRRSFSEGWADECEAAIEQRPITCYLAVEKQTGIIPQPAHYDLLPEKLVGFACYDVVAKGMFGPEGVHPDHRGQGIGRALLLTCLNAMKADRYAYAVIGWAGPADFYARVVGATVIEGSEPGIYRGSLTGLTS